MCYNKIAVQKNKKERNDEMTDTFKLEDTDQRKRMKEYVLNNPYNNIGEMYQLLNYETLHNLVKNIKKGEVKLNSSFVYNRDSITKEEKFLENLDNYIEYVKRNYFICPLELNLLIEAGLENKYVKILYSDKDFHTQDNYNEFYNSFRKMFLCGFYNNLLYYSKQVSNKSPIKRLLRDLKDYKFDSDEDILKIEKVLSTVFSIRNDNLYDTFLDHSKYKKNEAFQIEKIEWVISDYYKKHREKYFELDHNDYYFVTGDSTTVLFNIYDTDLDKMKDNDWITVEFGIQNSYFTAKVVEEMFTKKEFLKFYKLLHNTKMSSYDEYFDLINSTLRFNFWGEQMQHFLEIYFIFMENSTDTYKLSLNGPDIFSLLKIIDLQLNTKTKKTTD